MSLPNLSIVRHGETAWTDARKHTGRTDVPLNSVGEMRARQLGVRLKDFTFAKVFTSPMQRAAKACELAGLGGSAEIDCDLLEWDYRRFEEMLTAEIVRECLEWELFRDGSPGGVAARADCVVVKVQAATGEVLAFSSGHISRMIAARWLGFQPHQARDSYCAPTSLGILGFEHGRRDEPVLGCWNEISARRRRSEAM